MLIKDIQRCRFIIASDNTALCELLHPDKDGLNIGYSIAYAVLKPKCSSQRHRLRESSEVYFILEGDGLMHIDDESAAVRQGQAIFIPPLSWQFIENTGTDDLLILCIVNPCWRKEDEEIHSAAEARE